MVLSQCCFSSKDSDQGEEKIVIKSLITIKSISYHGDNSIVFPKIIKKAILMRGVPGTSDLGGSNFRLFFIPRVKSSKFDPRYKYLTLGGQYCIIVLQWSMLSSLRDCLLH